MRNAACLPLDRGPLADQFKLLQLNIQLPVQSSDVLSRACYHHSFWESQHSAFNIDSGSLHRCNFVWAAQKTVAVKQGRPGTVPHQYVNFASRVSLG